MRLALAIAGIVALPAAGACTLFQDHPYVLATEDDIFFVENHQLHRIHEGVDSRVIQDGLVFSVAVTSTNVIVSGQTGLGADCSGTTWLRLLDLSGNVVWERSEGATWNHEQGPIVYSEGRYWKLSGEELSAFEADVPPDSRLLDWTAELEPVLLVGHDVVVGENQVVANGARQRAAAAHNESETAILFYGGGPPQFHRVDAKNHLEISAPRDHLPSWDDSFDLVWTDTWHVLAYDRVFRLIGENRLQDLGVEAVALGARGNQTLIFSSDDDSFFVNHYDVYEGGVKIESFQKVGDRWIGNRATSTPTSESITPSREPSPSAEESPKEGWGIPSLGFLPLVGWVLLGASLARRRTLRSGPQM